MYDALTGALTPDALTVTNESQNHNVPQGSETHFKIVAVSKHFVGLSRVERHRLVNTLLKSEFDGGLHALSLFLYTAEQWKNVENNLIQSPPCQHQ